MKTIIFTISILLTSITLSAQDSISGVWDMNKENTKIEIKKNQDFYSGTVLSSDKLQAGALMLKDIKSVDGEWKGKLFSLKKKKWYDAVLEKKDEKLFVTIDAGFMSKTFEWTKG